MGRFYPHPLSFFHHCSSICRLAADAILSFANRTNIVHDVMTTVTELLIHWAQTPSGYNVLFAWVVWPDWAARHLPVLSQKGKHHLYTAYKSSEPDGQLVICHNGCGTENRFWVDRPKTVKLVCNTCSSECSVTRVPQESGVLGSQSLKKVEFPQGQARTTWIYFQQSASPDDEKSPPCCVLAADTNEGQPPTSLLADVTMGHPDSPAETSSSDLLQSEALSDDSAAELDDMEIDPPTIISTPASPPPPSHSHTPSESARLTISIPPCTSSHRSHSALPTGQATRSSRALLTAPAMAERSQSAPEVKTRNTLIHNPPTSLANFPSLTLSTAPRKQC